MKLGPPPTVASSGILGNEGGTGRRLLRLLPDNCVPPQRGEAVEGPDRRKPASTRASKRSSLAPLWRNRSRARSPALGGLTGYTLTPWSSSTSTTRPSGRSIAAHSPRPCARHSSSCRPHSLNPTGLCATMPALTRCPARPPPTPHAPHLPSPRRCSTAWPRLLRPASRSQSRNGWLPLYRSSRGTSFYRTSSAVLSPTGTVWG